MQRNLLCDPVLPSNDSIYASVKSYLPVLTTHSFPTHLPITWRKLYPLPNSSSSLLVIAHSTGFFAYKLRQNSLALASTYTGAPIRAAALLPCATRLAMVSEGDSPDFPRSTVRIYSLPLQKTVHVLRFSSQVLGVLSHSSSSYLAVVLDKEIHVFSSEFEFVVALKSHPSRVHVVASLSSEWLAYAGRDPAPSSLLGTTKLTEESSSQMSELSLKVGAGLVSLGEAGRKGLSSWINGTEAPKLMTRNGTVVIRDLKLNRTIVEFKAATSDIAFLQFDPSGTLLAVVPSDAQYFEVFQVIPFPTTKSQSFSSSTQKLESSTPTCKPKHAYRLLRGMTRGVIRDISFSPDSSWLVVSSQRGTTHVYPINRSGGPVTVYSHSDMSPPNPTHQHPVESGAIMIHSLFRARGFVEQVDLNSSIRGYVEYPASVSGFLEKNLAICSTRKDKSELLKIYSLCGIAKDAKLALNTTLLDTVNLSELVREALRLNLADPKLVSALYSQWNASEPVKESGRMDWLAQVETKTSDPSRRLFWDSPQFELCLYNPTSNLWLKSPLPVTARKRRRSKAPASDSDPPLVISSLESALETPISASWEEVPLERLPRAKELQGREVMNEDYFQSVTRAGEQDIDPEELLWPLDDD